MNHKKWVVALALIATALILTHLPVSEADAAASASDFQIEGSTLTKYRGSDERVTIPDTVEVVGESAFENNQKVQLVVVPKSVKRMDAYVFWGCDNLEEVVLGMVGDVVEYGQWKTHVRQESLIFAGGSIGTKVGAGLASAAMTGLLTFAGYVTSSSGVATQSQETLNMIINIYKFGPIIIALLAFVTLALYKLDKMYPDIMKELTEREARGEL